MPSENEQGDKTVNRFDKIKKKYLKRKMYNLFIDEKRIEKKEKEKKYKARNYTLHLNKSATMTDRDFN